MSGQYKNNFDEFLDTLRKTPDKEPVVDDSNWEWNCSPETRKVLQNMGLYDTMYSLLKKIDTETVKTRVELAKSKLDALQKAMGIIKSAISVNESTGGDNDDAVDTVVVEVGRVEEEEDGQEVEKA